MGRGFNCKAVLVSLACTTMLWGCFGSSSQEVEPPSEPAPAVEEQATEPATDPGSEKALEKPVTDTGVETLNADGRVLSTGVGAKPGQAGACEWVEYAAETGRTLRSLASIPIECPKSWSLAVAPEGQHGLLFNQTTWLMNFTTGNAMPLPKVKGEMELAYWYKGLPTLAGELAYTADQERAAKIYYSENGLPMKFCSTLTLKNAQWIPDDEPREIGLTEGSIGPYCMGEADEGMRIVRPLFDTHGVGYPRMNVALVPGVQSITKNEEAFFEWAWANGGESGGIAISTIWNEGAHLTGEAAAWDGKQWHLLDAVERPVSLARPLPNGDTFICAANGHGAVDTKTGKPRYWNPNGCLGLDESWNKE